MPELLKMKKSQIWYTDFIIGVSIFLIILVIAFRFLTNNYIIPGKEIDLAQVELDKLSNGMMKEGIPVNWTEEEVISIGLLSEDGTLDIDKVSMMANLSESYTSLKWLLGVSHDFIIYFEDREGNKINLTDANIGKPNTSIEDVLIQDTETIASAVRYVAYRHDDMAELLAMKIVVWKE